MRKIFLNFINHSLANRLFVAFILSGFLPFILFLFYTVYLSETKIIDKLVLDQQHELSHTSFLLDTHLDEVKKELIFLSKLDLMDDILADDLDQRISRLLKQKKNDYNLDLDFFALNTSMNIIASSAQNTYNVLELQEKIKQGTGYFVIGERLYIFSEICASFDKAKTIGHLILRYNLENLKIYMKHSSKELQYIQHNDILIGTDTPYKIQTLKKNGSEIFQDHIIVYQEIDSFLDSWIIFYVVKKSIAFEFFYEFIRFVFYLFPFLIILTIFLSKRLAKYIVGPIEELTKVTDEIVYSKEYSKLLHLASSDELGRLAHSFNVLLNTTDKTLDASQAKSAFISNMSHELKTPLNAIIGFSQYLILYEELTEEQLDIVSNIENSAQYLLEMIYGVLDIAKIEAGKVDVNIKELDCVGVVKECFTMLEPLAYDKGLQFDFVILEEKTKTFPTDEKIIKQIIINLLSNAIKYTQEGYVELELSVTEEEFLVKVKDSGVGLEREDMIHLFKEFSRIENGLSGKQKGTGLGLSLSKKLSHIIGGNIHLESKGKSFGTTAVFYIKRK